MLDLHIPGLDCWDRHGRTEPLRSRWATVDHVIPEIRGGMDAIENLAACCVICNSRKGARASNNPLNEILCGWDGLSNLFIALSSKYTAHLSSEDIKWIYALQRKGVTGKLSELDTLVTALKEAKQSGPELLEKLLCGKI